MDIQMNQEVSNQGISMEELIVPFLSQFGGCIAEARLLGLQKLGKEVIQFQQLIKYHP